MSKKEIKTNETQDMIIKAMDLVEELVCNTMGPGGRNVLIEVIHPLSSKINLPLNKSSSKLYS